MKKALLAVSVFLLVGPAAWAFEIPRFASAAPVPSRTAGAFTTANAVLSGTITPYAAGGRGLNYLTVSIDGKLQGGSFIVAPDVAAQLRGMMDPGRNYIVNLVYATERVNINGFTPAYGVVTQVNFIDPNGLVYASVKAGR